MKKELYKIKVVFNGIRKILAPILRQLLTLLPAIMSFIFTLLGIVAFQSGRYGLSALEESKENDKKALDLTCETNMAGRLNTTTLKYCLNLDGFNDVRSWMFVQKWAGFIIFLIGFIGLLLFLFCDNQHYSASEWLKTMSLYPIVLVISMWEVYKSAITTGSISGLTSIFSSIIVVSATIKLWDECWKYQTLCKEEKQQKLALYDASTLEFNLSMSVSVNKFDTPPSQSE